MKQYLLALFVLIVASPAYAQDTKTMAIQELKLVNMAYKNMNKLKFNTTYQVDVDSVGKLVTNIAEGTTIINGNKKFQQLGHIETYVNENYFLSLDHLAKNISISSQEINYSKEFEFLPENIANVINKCDSVYRIEHKNNETTYGFITQSSSYDKIELTFQNKTKLITMLTMHRTESKQLVTIKYFNYTTKAIPEHEWFSYQRFLTINNNKLVNKPSFAHYQLYSQILDIHSLK